MPNILDYVDWRGDITFDTVSYTHLDVYKRQDTKALEKAKVEISGEDFREGLIAVISVKVAAVSYTHLNKRLVYHFKLFPFIILTSPMPWNSKYPSVYSATIKS